jgi:hypothetical protein
VPRPLVPTMTSGKNTATDKEKKKKKKKKKCLKIFFFGILLSNNKYTFSKEHFGQTYSKIFKKQKNKKAAGL